MWSVKNCQGVDAAHSSPMKSMGVKGPVRTSAACPAQASSPERVRGEAVALGAVADLVVGLGVAQQPGRAETLVRSRGRPWRRSRKVEYVPSWK